MREYFAGDERRIEHNMRVLGFAESILAHEPGSQDVVLAAAVLHDVGIPAAEAKYGSSVGRYQEIQGPPIAREIMSRLAIDEAVADHVSRIIANHHSARDIDTPEFRIVWDADWLVNLPGESSGAKPEELAAEIARIFKTPTGRRLAESLYLSQTQ
jgi:HD superfamily phosphodiesterase